MLELPICFVMGKQRISAAIIVVSPFVLEFGGNELFFRHTVKMAMNCYWK